MRPSCNSRFVPAPPDGLVRHQHSQRPWPEPRCHFYSFRLAQTPSARETLQQADRFADQGDWYRAGPLYAKAEADFRAMGDRRNELYAKLGRLHREAETGGYRMVRDQISGMLTDPVLTVHPDLRIRALSTLGSVHLNLDTEAAERDWKEVLRIATETNDLKWQNRARGQLAVIAGLNGDIGAAGLALFQAIQKASEIGDIAGVVHFSI